MPLVKHCRRWLWVSVLVIIFDQLSKFFALRHLTDHVPVHVFPFLNFTLMYNRGAAFSFLSGAGGWQLFLFASLAVIASAVILVMLWRLPAHAHGMALSLSLILGGAIGNLIDRIRIGAVVDFISFHVHGWYFATFNIADSAITIGVVLLLWLTWTRKQPAG